MAVEGGTVSHYYILVIRKFIDLMSLFRHSVWFSFSVKQFPSAEFGICNILLIRTAEELSYEQCFAANLRPVSNVVLLPCRTQLIELNSTLARQ